MKQYTWMLCLTLLVGCHGRQATGESLLPDTLQLQEGDVVFRRCSGLTSQMVVHSDTGGVFSHVGIVVDSAGQKLIVHAVPEEPDYPGDPDRVKMSRPEVFYAKGYALAAAVRRPRDPQVGRRAAQKALEIYRRGTLFDHDFDDSDTTLMYCTELIVHAYRAAGIELTDSQHHEVRLPLVSYRVVMPSQLLQSSELQPIYMFNP